jgi:hypothetical protein
LKDIVDKMAEFIETWATDQASTLLVKNWGFAELVNRESRGKASTGTQPIPVTIPGDGSECQQIALDDRFNFIFWIRVFRTTPVQNEQDEWGLKDGKRLSLPMRIVIAHRNNLGENLVYNLANDIPASFVVPGFEFMFTENIDVDNDHETIHDTELGKTNYEKHRFPWNIYVINLNVEFITCTGYVPPDFITDEHGNYLFA